MDEMPNVFISEDGTVTIVNSEEIPKDQVELLTHCDAYCRMMENRYGGTKDIFEMMAKGATRKRLIEYMDCRHTLMLWGYD